MAEQKSTQNNHDEKTVQDQSDQTGHLLRLMLDATPLGCVLCDSKLNIIDVNQATLNLFGTATKEEFYRSYPDLSPPFQPDGTPSRDKARHYFAQALTHGRVAFEWMHQTVSGSPIPTEITIVAIKSGEEEYFTAYINDLREIRRTMNLLRSLEGKVYRDELTEIYNRRYLFEAGEKEFRNARAANQPLSCIMFDIDFFKKVNDTHGHQVGDTVLHGLARLVAEELRKDCLFARYGGEEFIILLPGTIFEAAEKVAERIRKKTMHWAFPTPDGDISVTISLGVACIGPEQSDLEELINAADNALYLAKRTGRNNTKVFERDGG